MCDFLIPMLSHDITIVDRERFTGLMFAFSTPLKFLQNSIKKSIYKAYYIKLEPVFCE